MNNSKIAIKVTGVAKGFKLPHERLTSVKSKFVNVFRGKKTFERQQVLNDVSFEIKKGEFFGVAGRNGSGKSTLLKLLAGIYSPDKGSIEVNGALTPFIELGVGFNPELTGKENVFLNGALLGFSRQEMLGMYDEIVQFAELHKFMDQKLKNYSSGMQVRLAFSIAIKADTEILLFDEVLAVGDAKFQKKCLQVFRELKDAGKTIILVSHSTADMERFCDRILVLDKGESLGIFSAREGSLLYQEINFEEKDVVRPDTQKDEKRWGSGLVRIDKVTAYSKDNEFIQTSNPFTVELKIKRGDADSDLPIKIGVAFYDSDGINISGPNSYRKKIIFRAGEEELIAVFNVKENILNRGQYKITAAVVAEDETTVYDQRIDIAKFEVISEIEHFGKVVTPGVWDIRK